MQIRRLGLAACFNACFAPGLAQAAAPVVDGKLCGKACRQTFRTVRFSDAPDGAYFQLQECSSLLHQQALYLCWDLHCLEEVRLAEATILNETCIEIWGAYIPPHDVVDGFDDGDIAQFARFDESLDRMHSVDEVVLPTQVWYELWMRTLDSYNFTHRYHSCYGWAMGIFWAFVVALGIANRAFTRLATWSSRSASCQSRSSLWLKRHIFMPATFGRRCVQDFAGWGTLPPRVQSLTVVLFVLVNVACTIHGYRIFPGYVYYPTVSQQVFRHVSDRTGIMSFANFPIIWLFGMRNNVVIWLTGWHFGTYNNFHRWVARVATFQAVVHSIGYTILILRKGGTDYFWQMCKMLYWWTGELATIFMSLLIGFSMLWIRRRQYEIFLIVHIVFSALVLLTMLGHVSIFKGAYDPLWYIPACIWLFDRIVRGLRVVAFSPRFWSATAQITYNGDAHMVRLVVPVSLSFYRIEPGTFYYLMVLNKWNFWESHPFTVASVSRGAHYDVESGDETSPLLRHGPNCSDSIVEDSEKCTQEMTFLIRPYESFTSRLKGYAEERHPEPARVRIAVDGPYGETLPLKHFSKVVFLVGGSGIAVPLSYLQQLTTSSPLPRLIQIHWTIRQPALAVDVLNRELNDALNCDRVKIFVYVTGADGSERSDDAIFRLAEWKSTRMKVEEVLDAALDVAQDGSLAVVASGPGKMADDTRRAVAARIVHTLPRIEYFEESFQW